MMETVNCLRCRFRHEDNGNCTAVGGFCTAVAAAHCPLLREYLDTGLEPEEIERSKLEIEAGCVKAIARTYGIDINRLRKLAEADRDGRVVVLPCKPDGSMLNTSDPERPEIMKRIHFAVAYVCGGIVFHQPYNIFIENVAAGYIRPLNEEAEKALEAMKDV
jgi:hypothetical protein|nr:MAG TPA: hypothetical protein [Caudoviricetes sp.]